MSISLLSVFRHSAHAHRPFEKYYIPPGKAWFQLDKNTGVETFYLLASGDRLNSLETLYERYQSAASQELANEILCEIRKTKKQRRNLKARAERPLSIGGVLRDVGRKIPDVASVAERISATDFYGRTFTIEHK
ncbi:MAG: hypothetical protein DRI57_08820 [Deltaproteobacteria bacterium]|nr:MAG: hypothetical protein DRI57_08820 [Deltaproteobacteria bacterium]